MKKTTLMHPVTRKLIRAETRNRKRILNRICRLMKGRRVTLRRTVPQYKSDRKCR